MIKGVWIILIILGVVIALLLALFFIRLFSERQIDDVSPGISCENSLLEKSDAYYVIPKFENKSILENKAWIEKIVGMKKDLRLHGVYHTFNEFGTNRDVAYLEEGINIFEQAFNSTPTRFKAPQLELSKENKMMIEERGLEVDGFWNQLFHKVYHCSDTGRFSNRFIDWF